MFSENYVCYIDRSVLYPDHVPYSTNYCRDENQKLPVPGDILSMFGGQDKPSVVDDPALHQGRIRSFAHERGNWASLVYISCMLLNITVFYFICCGCIC